jgi:hypothetical protein
VTTLPAGAAPGPSVHRSATAWTITAVLWGLTAIAWSAAAVAPPTTHTDLIGADTVPIGQWEGTIELDVEAPSLTWTSGLVALVAWVALLATVWLGLSVVRRVRREVVAVLLLTAVPVVTATVAPYGWPALLSLAVGVAAIAIARWPLRDRISPLPS